jgi:hypothetical protein
MNGYSDMADAMQGVLRSDVDDERQWMLRSTGCCYDDAAMYEWNR